MDSVEIQNKYPYRKCKCFQQQMDDNKQELYNLALSVYAQYSDADINKMPLDKLSFYMAAKKIIETINQTICTKQAML